jgi:DNA-directed RNA polymerase subunit RPC12/RpoP
MTFTTKCRRCQKAIEFLDVQIGTKLRCPRCNKRMILEVNTSSWVKGLLILVSIVVLIGVVFFLLVMFEPGVEDSMKDNANLIKKFLSGSGPPKK